MPTLCMVLVTLIWGASYILVKIALQEMCPSTFIFLRFLFASVCVLPVFAFYRPKFNRLDVIRGAVLGLLLVGINFLQTVGMQTISASLSAFLTGVSIVFVFFIKLMVQKKLPTTFDASMVLICVVGLGLVTGSSGVTWEAGVLYTLLCAFFVALHTYVLSDYAAEGDALVLTLLQIVVLAVISGFCALAVDGDVRIPTQAATWWSLLLCAVLCSTVAFGMQTYAQKYITAFKASVILMLEPVFTTFFAQIMLDEVLHPQFYVGACMILGAIALMTVRLKHIE
jgi:drug/metabolite transporter (DMT)-like permease